MDNAVQRGDLGEGSKGVIPCDKLMLKVGDTMAGFLDLQSAANQVEAIYIAYFARAAEEPGLNYWTATYNSQIASGNSVDITATNIANTFALQTEAKNLYGFLASPPSQVNANDPVQVAGATAMIIAVYQNLFNRTVTSTDAGVTYWVNQILTQQVGIGTAIYAIANGALVLIRQPSPPRSRPRPISRPSPMPPIWARRSRSPAGSSPPPRTPSPP